MAKKKEIRLIGQAISRGIAIGPMHYFAAEEEEIAPLMIDPILVEGEVARYKMALQRSRLEVQKLKCRLEQERAWDGVAILDAHLYLLQDPTLTESIEKKIRLVHHNTETAVQETLSEYQKRFNKISDSFFQERFKDIQDISRRIISHLQEKVNGANSMQDFPSDAIIFSDELSPSDAAEVCASFGGAFVTHHGGDTSHTAIMAKAQGIPYVTSIDLPLSAFTERGIAIVDGFKGEVILHPTKSSLTRYQELLCAWKGRVAIMDKQALSPSITQDGHEVVLKANVETIADIDLLHQYGGQGVGLFRSESILLSQGTFPTEEEQFHHYKTLIMQLKGLPMVLRTFDIGGDKFGSFYVMRKESNPYLGLRAIRLMLKEKEIFKTQLRAILRAGYFGKIKILFPMISGLAELQAAKLALEEAKCELKTRGERFSEDYQIGCMIEVPSAALISDILAKECHFLSLGTNDLTQYCMAVDRGNQAMNYLYTPLHPSVLRMIKMVVEEGKRHNIPISVCGEMAADPRYTPLLVGLGVDEISVIPRLLPHIKEAVRSLSLKEAKEKAARALVSSHPEEVGRLFH